MDAIKEIANFVVNRNFCDLPAEVVKHDKYLILDTLACGLAGAAAPGCRELAQWALETGGAEQATVLVFGGKIPAIHAGMVNATLFQALDFDDTHDKAIAHTHCTCLAAGLAVAEQLGNVCGERLITALTLGAEVMGRIGRSIHAPLRFNRTGTLASFGAATVAGKLMGLNVEQHSAAYGIAYAQTASTLQSNVDGALVKRMHPGFAVRCGITACQLALKGITGPVHVLEGPYGYMPLYENNDYDREAIVRDLGTEWDMLHIGLKPFPCARDAVGALEAGIMLHEKGIDHHQIRSVHIAMPEVAWRVSGKSYDDITGNPVVESILSAAWCGALGLAKGTAGLEDFSPEGVRNPEIRELARKVQLSVDASVPAASMVPVTMTAVMNNGREYSGVCRRLKGSWEAPLSLMEVERKLAMCAAASLYPISKKRLQKLSETVHRLEHLQDSADLVQLMLPEASPGLTDADRLTPA